MGAFWDPELKNWYVPRADRLASPSKWLPDVPGTIIAMMPFYVPLNTRTCSKCRTEIPIIALAANGFYALNEPNDDRKEQSWIYEDAFTFSSYPTWVSAECSLIKLAEVPAQFDLLLKADACCFTNEKEIFQLVKNYTYSSLISDYPL